MISLLMLMSFLITNATEEKSLNLCVLCKKISVVSSLQHHYQEILFFFYEAAENQSYNYEITI